MISYLYDGTYIGLLSAIYQAINYQGIIDCIVAESKFEPDLFTKGEVIISDPVLANQLLTTLTRKLLRPALWDLYFCFLAEEDGVEMLILDFVQKALLRGSQVAQNYSDFTVLEIRKISDRVSYEIHRLHGFVRFRKMKDGIFYAPIEPDYNILSLLAPHFSARFADQQWLIHDLKRQKGIYYNGIQCSLVQWVEVNPEAFTIPERYLSGNSLFSENEPVFQELWNDYFQAVTIRERTNKKLQRQHMPQRYWKYLIEQVKK